MDWNTELGDEDISIPLIQLRLWPLDNMPFLVPSTPESAHNTRDRRGREHKVSTADISIVLG